MVCYVAKLGYCSGRITREHFLSLSTLKLAGTKIQLSGFSWQETNEPIVVGINFLPN